VSAAERDRAVSIIDGLTADPNERAALKAIAQVESDFDPGAIGARGERGLGQITPATARALAVMDPELLLEPGYNLAVVLRLVRQLRRQIGSFGWPEVASAYNCGLKLAGDVWRSRCWNGTTYTNADYVAKLARAFVAWGGDPRSSAVLPGVTQSYGNDMVTPTSGGAGPSTGTVIAIVGVVLAISLVIGIVRS